MRRTSRPYVGVKNGVYETFRSFETPTQASHGYRYNAVIGPFRTARGAIFMRDHGKNNPHCNTVAEAERLAAKLL